MPAQQHLNDLYTLISKTFDLTYPEAVRCWETSAMLVELCHAGASRRSSGDAEVQAIMLIVTAVLRRQSRNTPKLENGCGDAAAAEAALLTHMCGVGSMSS